jgi:hypothetical protein
MKHQLKERKGTVATTKCGVTVPIEQTTAWASKTTCPDCAPLMDLDERIPLSVDHAWMARRLVKRK